jgi:hypothetical protein
MEVGREDMILGMSCWRLENMGTIDAFIHHHRRMERPCIQALNHTVISTTHPRRFNPQ